MCQTCMFCGRGLGENTVIEDFPVGRRLAFDAARGRLWVVCRSCERWNLTPLEERSEAVEACERHFRDTRVRVSTENVGLARLREGLELVRIGAPLRPEFAAWRYGDQFGRRRKRAFPVRWRSRRGPRRGGPDGCGHGRYRRLHPGPVGEPLEPVDERAHAGQAPHRRRAGPQAEAHRPAGNPAP